MSDQPPSTEPPPPAAPRPPARSGCATAIMVLVGIVLLLPGLCAILLTGMVPGHFGREEFQLVAVCGAAAVVGIFLIVAAMRS
jgi:hypothetical protein